MQNLEVSEYAQIFSHGVLDGYLTGMENNIFDQHKEPERHNAYRKGFDYGIILYCEDNPGN